MMKKTLAATLVLGLAAAAAQADTSVTLWGNVDGGVMYTKFPGGHTVGFTEGQLAPSEFGFKGTEDLGDGMKVGFALTAGFDVGNGTQDANNAPNSFFGRECKVTLGGSWGTVGAGLQFDPALLSSISTEPRGLADSFSNLGPAVMVTFPIVKPYNSPGGSGGAFDANSVSYTYAANGLYLGALHEFGGVANSSSALSGNAIGLSYTNSGLTGSAGYSTLNGATGSTNSQIGVYGLGYTNGPFAVRAQYGTYKAGYGLLQPGVPASNMKSTGIGFDWNTSAVNKLNLAYYNMKDSGAIGGGGTNTFAILDTYKLSKRTTVFAQIAMIKADKNPGLTNVEIYTVAGTGTAGGTSTAIGFGVNHAF